MSAVGDFNAAIEKQFRELLEGMETRPRMYCSSYASLEECYLTVCTLLWEIRGSDWSTAIEPHKAWWKVCRKHGAGNATLAVRIERLQERDAFSDDVAWEWMTKATREIRDMAFPEWREAKRAKGP